MLVDRGGRIVSREDIRKRLWPDDTIVNYDHSINVAIRIIRRALGDSAGGPRYVETLARRGYRLMVDAEPLLTQAGPSLTRSKPASPTVMTGEKVSHYRVLATIGGGGMGMVYRAEDLKLGRPVALKFLPPEVGADPIALRRFEQEARTASCLNDPHICTIHGIDEHHGNPFIVMELLEGRSLNHALDAAPSKRLSIAQLLESALQICDGLHAAHQKGIIHRDIKPANIFLTQRGPVKILDFGVAKLMETEEEREPGAMESQKTPHNLTMTGTTMGTAGYMSPEQIRREKLDARSDLFSFGLVLYEAATGTRAFVGEAAEITHQAILHDDPAPPRSLNPAIPRALEAVILKSLQKDPALRYQSAAEVRIALEQSHRKIRPFSVQTAALPVVAALLAFAVWAVWTHSLSSHPVALSSGDTVVLAVTNQTGDPVFYDALYIALLTGFEQTPYLNVLAVNKVGAALAKQHLAIDPTRMAPQVARQVCLDTSSKVAINASISEAGNNFRIDLDSVECSSGQTMAHVQGDASSRAQIMYVLGGAAAQMRRELGEPTASVNRFNKPLEEAVSPSPEALQLLTEGYRRNLLNDVPGAISNYVRATELDQNLGIAYVALAAARASTGEPDLAASAATRAYVLRNRMTEPNRFNAEDIYYFSATGELEKRSAVLVQWEQTFPENYLSHYNLAHCLRMLGQLDSSLAEAHEAVRLLPSALSYETLMLDEVAIGRVQEAINAYTQAEARGFDSAQLHELRAHAAFLQNDRATMEQQWRWAVGKPGADRQLLYGRAITEAYYGHYRQYRSLTEHATSLAIKEDSPLDAGFYSVNGALREAEAGDNARARQLAEKALTQSQTRESRAQLALALARAGNTARAQEIADRISREAPSDTLIQNYFLPAIRAAIRLSANDPAGALKILLAAEKFDFVDPDVFDNLYLPYLRGLAYLQMRQGHLAAIEFQKLLGRPYFNGTDEIGAVSRLQMARAYSLQGERTVALKSYEDFLQLWHNADPDLPAYQQAKAEYKSLRANKPLN